MKCEEEKDWKSDRWIEKAEKGKKKRGREGKNWRHKNGKGKAGKGTERGEGTAR